MKRWMKASCFLIVLTVGISVLANQRVSRSTTNEFVHFYAVQSSDHITPYTGGTTWTVYYHVAGATGSTAMTTPTVTEIDATNMPGWYELKLDEIGISTIASGNDFANVAIHITHASMDPVPLSIGADGILSRILSSLWRH